MTLSSLRERVYNAYCRVLEEKGLLPPPRHSAKDKDLDGIIKIVDSVEDAEIEPFIVSQFDSQPLDYCARLTLGKISRESKRSREKFAAYRLKFDIGRTNYKAEILRLNATVSYYARTWGCSEQEVVSDPNVAFPAWYRFIRLEDEEIKRIYAKAAEAELNSKALREALEVLNANEH